MPQDQKTGYKPKFKFTGYNEAEAEYVSGSYLFQPTHDPVTDKTHAHFIVNSQGRKIPVKGSSVSQVLANIGIQDDLDFIMKRINTKIKAVHETKKEFCQAAGLNYNNVIRFLQKTGETRLYTFMDVLDGAGLEINLK